MKFIDIERHSHNNVSTASLQVPSDAPHLLCVLGTLHHCTSIRPKTQQDADRLRKWLDANYPSSQVTALRNAQEMLQELINLSNDTEQIDVARKCVDHAQDAIDYKGSVNG